MGLTRMYSPELRNLLDWYTAPDPRNRPYVVTLFNEALVTMRRMLEVGFESSRDAEGRLRPYHGLVLFTEHGQRSWHNDPAFRRRRCRGIYLASSQHAIVPRPRQSPYEAQVPHRRRQVTSTSTAPSCCLRPNRSLASRSNRQASRASKGPAKQNATHQPDWWKV